MFSLVVDVSSLDGAGVVLRCAESCPVVSELVQGTALWEEVWLTPGPKSSWSGRLGSDVGAGCPTSAGGLLVRSPGVSILEWVFV